MASEAGDRSPRAFITYAALLVVGSVAGFLAGRLTDRTVPADSAAIANLRRTIEDAIGGLREEVHAAEAKPERLEQSSRTPVDVDRLTAAVEKLNVLLEANAAGAGAGREPRAAGQVGKGPGYPTLDSMWHRIGPLAYKADQQSIGDLCDELCKAHFLWTRADVLDRYGSPSRVEGGRAGGLLMDYESAATEGAVIHVRTADGIVTGVDFTPRLIER